MEKEQSQGESKRRPEVSDWEEYIEEEQSRAEVKSYQEVSDWEESSEEEQSQGKISTFQKLPKWEESSEEEQSHGNGSSYPELTESEETSTEGQFRGKFSGFQERLSDWEDSVAEELSQDEDSFGQEFSDWEVYRPSILSRWEDDSDRELMLQDWERMTMHSFEVRPLRPEDDEWEELSVLELSQGQGTEHRLGILAEEGFLLPVPREAWVECRVCASPPWPAAQTLRGTPAPPTLDKQVAQAGTRSQGPAPESPRHTRSLSPPLPEAQAPRGAARVLLSPSRPQLEAQAPRGAAAPPALRRQVAEAATQTWAPRKRPSRFRRILRALARLFRACAP
ncbi:uncharacterized protein LOC113976527 [Neopelma chrysocephalum]|uniref:uncharacterized protein LOC113976527 n=1 Tax=Neopelma chrysocephalum TaxID=114329 RepID=UPI000FCD1B2D|nr:uncharacterized protein LOC113976527 [Neopelma chrysocephalum]